MINRVVLIGRLTKDIELKSTASGKLTTSFTLAVQRDAEKADFVPCVAWERKAELLSEYCRKGSLIGLEGRIQTRSYDSNGRTVYVTEVIANDINFLGKKDESEQQAENYATNRQVLVNPASELPFDMTADDLPF